MNRRADFYKYAEGDAHIDLDNQKTFENIFREEGWKETQNESVSGPGSTFDQTREIIQQLPLILDTYQIQSFLDIPCGNFNWLSRIDWSGRSYTGIDIVEDLIISNQRKNGSDYIRFLHADVTVDDLPAADLLFCRDLLVHFSYELILKTLKNIKRSNIQYLMTTTFTEEPDNEDRPTGGWRPLDLTSEPFNFPFPQVLLNEKCTEGNGLFKDKSLGLWLTQDISL